MGVVAEIFRDPLKRATVAGGGEVVAEFFSGTSGKDQ